MKIFTFWNWNMTHIFKKYIFLYDRYAVIIEMNNNKKGDFFLF